MLWPAADIQELLPRMFTPTRIVAVIQLNCKLKIVQLSQAELDKAGYYV